jgi:hypothetical protein
MFVVIHINGLGKALHDERSQQNTWSQCQTYSEEVVEGVKKLIK